MAKFVELHRGYWIDGADQTTSLELMSLCSVIADCVTDAMLALYMFERDMPESDKRVRHQRRQRYAQLEAIRRQELAAEGFPDGDEPADIGERELQRAQLLHQQAARDVMRACWDAGELPRVLAIKVPSLHAQTFTKALARLSRALRVLEKIAPASSAPAIKAAYVAFETDFPEVKPLRDSLEHAEDRRRGRDRRGDRVPAVPFENDFAEGGANLLVGESLIGRRYGGTADDGTHAEIEVSDATVEAARVAAQAAFDALPWKPGPRQFDPAAAFE
jgi:hypothetical protein